MSGTRTLGPTRLMEGQIVIPVLRYPLYQVNVESECRRVSSRRSWEDPHVPSRVGEEREQPRHVIGVGTNI